MVAQCPVCGSKEPNRRTDDGRCFPCYQKLRPSTGCRSSEWACLSCGLLVTLSVSLDVTRALPCWCCSGSLTAVQKYTRDDAARQATLWDTRN